MQIKLTKCRKYTRSYIYECHTFELNRHHSGLSYDLVLKLQDIEINTIKTITIPISDLISIEKL